MKKRDDPPTFEKTERYEHEHEHLHCHIHINTNCQPVLNLVMTTSPRAVCVHEQIHTRSKQLEPVPPPSHLHVTVTGHFDSG